MSQFSTRYAGDSFLLIDPGPSRAPATTVSPESAAQLSSQQSVLPSIADPSSPDSALHLPVAAVRESTVVSVPLQDVEPVAAIETQANVDHHVCTVLFDTGAEVSVVSHRLCQQFGLLPVPSRFSHAGTFDDRPTSVLGTVPLALTLHFGNASVHTPWRCIVVDKPSTSILLGMDFLCHYHLRPDPRDRTVSAPDAVYLCSPPHIGSVLTPHPSVGPPTPPKPLDVDTELRQKVQTLTHLSALQQDELLTLLSEFRDVFSTGADDIGCIAGVHHTIDTGTHAPTRSIYKRWSPAERDAISQHVDLMLRAGIIRPSTSPWCSESVLTLKKDGSSRFCVDFRGVNKFTVRDAYPLPRIDTILDSLSGAQYFSSLDLCSGYWQIPLDDTSIPKTAFRTPQGLYEYLRMPFGCCNASATFQRAMDTMFRDLLWTCVMAYQDDGLVYSREWSLHLVHLREVLVRVRTSNAKLKISKCNFCVQSIPFLGHLLAPSGVAPHPDRVAAIVNMPPPTDLTTLRSFLGMIGYYRRYVPTFSELARPLHDLLLEDTRWHWSTECEIAFLQLKTCLTSAPILAFPDFTRPFQLHTDASNIGLGAVLSQTSEGGVDRPVAYWSRTLSRPEKNYSATELECLAVVSALHEFRPLLHGTQVVLIYTDHSALRSLLTQKEPKAKFARWIQSINEFSYEIHYRPGSQNGNADGLSRLPHLGAATVDQMQDVSFLDPVVMREAQLSDPFCRAIMVHLEPAVLGGEAVPTVTVSAMLPLCHLRDGLLYYNGPVDHKGRMTQNLERLVVPRHLSNQVISLFHDHILAGHMGHERTYYRLLQRFYWPGMFSDCQQFVNTCLSCQERKNPRKPTYGQLQPITVTAPFDTVAFDIAGPFSVTPRGNRYVLVVSDYDTRWVEAFALPHGDAVTVANILVDEIICRYGAPQRFLSDRGQAFVGKVVAEVCRVFGTKKVNTSAYHPQTDGLVERFNGTLEAMLSHFVSELQNDWDVALPKLLFAYRTSLHSSLHDTPFFLLFGRDATFPQDVGTTIAHRAREPREVSQYRADLLEHLTRAREAARHALAESQARSKTRHDSRHAAAPFKLGDLVWVHVPRVPRGASLKLARLWRGPYVIRAVIGTSTYRLADASGTLLPSPVHASRLKSYKPRPIPEVTEIQSTDEPSPEMQDVDLSTPNDDPSLEENDNDIDEFPDDLDEVRSGFDDEEPWPEEPSPDRVPSPTMPTAALCHTDASPHSSLAALISAGCSQVGGCVNRDHGTATSEIAKYKVCTPELGGALVVTNLTVPVRESQIGKHPSPLCYDESDMGQQASENLPFRHQQDPLIMPSSVGDSLVFKAIDLLETDELPTFCRLVGGH